MLSVYLLLEEYSRYAVCLSAKKVNNGIKKRKGVTVMKCFAHLVLGQLDGHRLMSCLSFAPNFHNFMVTMLTTQSHALLPHLCLI